MDYDVLVIGSGFGGSVAALRLSERGYRVAVLEQGRRLGQADLERANQSARHLFWLPAIGLRGFFFQRFFQHLMVVGGVGVGGGSLVYAAVLLEPQRAFYEDPAWNGLGIDWQVELRPHFSRAARMLGRETCPTSHIQDGVLQETATRMGAGESFGPAPLGIYFGQPGIEAPDPYFDGAGPARQGCKLCGACLAGCTYNAKNTLDKNYLYLAERSGAKILPEHKATLVRPVAGGYQVELRNPLDGRKRPSLTASKVVIAAGVLGTLELLFASQRANALTGLSPRLGERVLTNSEAITGILAPSEIGDMTHGPAISSHFYPDATTHITQNRLPASYGFMKLYSGPLVDGSLPGKRAWSALGAFLRHPGIATASMRAGRNWHQRVTLLTTMRNQAGELRFRYGRGATTLFGLGLQSEIPGSVRSPTYIEQANRAARQFAQAVGGTPHNSLLESVFNLSVTAHILGGCSIGAGPESGVLDTDHQVFGHPGLYVLDASAIPANVGVNPSLTITALAERAASRI